MQGPRPIIVFLRAFFGLTRVKASASDEEPEPTKRRDADGRIDDALFKRVWCFVLEVGVQERHFNNLQSQYRVLASTWLLATFGAAGFVLTSQEIAMPFDRWLLVGLIGLAGGVGVLLLWNLDLLLYHSLLQTCFREGLAMEDRYPWLPRVRQRMMQGHGADVTPNVVWFYVLGAGAALAVAGVGASMWALTIGAGLGAGVAAACVLVVVGIGRLLFVLAQRQGERFKAQESLYPWNGA